MIDYSFSISGAYFVKLVGNYLGVTDRRAAGFTTRASLLERFPSFGLSAVEKMELITNHRPVTALAGGKHHTVLRSA